MIRNIDLWLHSYLARSIKKIREDWKNYSGTQHILFTICDHYEPYWNNVDSKQAAYRVKKWHAEFPKIASCHTDTFGEHPKHCFFYPEEEYKKDLLSMIEDICHAGYGETEIHLHHENDTSENLRKTLLDYADILAKDHGLLSKEKETGRIRYGFIHGNWALDNSRPDGLMCGVNNELDILQQTGCYADFTMPSAPDITQTQIINSIYYAVDDPDMPKSHDKGALAVAGKINNEGLLCIQGPLGFNFRSRKYGLIPRIENGCLSADLKMDNSRLNLWLNQRIHVHGRPDISFIKLHAHGAQEKSIDYFFDQDGLHSLYSVLESFCDNQTRKLYYVSTRQMYNVVKGLEKFPDADPADILETELILN